MNKHKSPALFDPIAKNVMDAISGGSVKMKPRRYFVLLNVALFVGGVAAALVASYLVALVAWWARLQVAAGPAFGLQRRLDELVASFPWWALVLAGGMIWLVVWLTRRVGIMYRYDLRLIVLIVVTVSLIVGAALSFSGVGRPNKDGPRRGQQAHIQQFVK